MRPEYIHEHFPEHIQNKRFRITTSHGETEHSQVATIPIPNLFNYEGFHQVFLYDFHHDYVRLIGSDLLNQINAVIDYKNKQVLTNNSVIKFYLPSKSQKLTSTQITIPARTEMLINLPTNSNNGTKICKQLNFSKRFNPKRSSKSF